MPEIATDQPRRATRTTILKDEVPAPPLPNQPDLIPPSKPGDGMDIFEWMESLTPKDWENYLVYLYWRPAGQRRTGPYLCKIVEAVDIDWIKKSYGGSGGGIFTLFARGDGNFVKSYDFEIEGERKFPENSDAKVVNPQVMPGESKLEKLLEMLIQRLMSGDPNNQSAFDMQKKAFENTLETVTKLPIQNPSPSILDTVRTLKELGIIGAPKDNLLDTIRALKDLELIGNNASNDPLKNIELVTKLIEATDKLRPEESSGSLGMEVAKGIFNGLPTIRQITQDLANAAKFNSMAAEREPSPQQQTTTAQAKPTQDPPQENPSIPSPPAEEVQPAAPAPQPTFDITDLTWTRVLNMIACGEDGDRIAQFISDLAPEMFEQLKAFTEGGLLQMLNGNAEIKKALEGRDAAKLVKQFCYFCRTGEMTDEEEEEPETLEN